MAGPDGDLQRPSGLPRPCARVGLCG